MVNLITLQKNRELTAIAIEYYQSTVCREVSGSTDIRGKVTETRYVIVFRFRDFLDCQRT